METIGIWLGALLTLCIFSFLYKDNPFYKFAEHMFVGVSAGYWMGTYFHNTIYPKLIGKIGHFFWELAHKNAMVVANVNGETVRVQGISFDFIHTLEYVLLIIPLVFSVLMLMRIFPRFSWMSRYGVSLMVGTGAGLFLIGYLKSNVIQQVAGLLKPVVEHSAEYGTTWATVGNLILIVGTIAGLSYFFFSKAHKGAFGVMTKVGIYFLMVSFGAAFGYTIMARISLLIGRLDFLINTWLLGTIFG